MSEVIVPFHIPVGAGGLLGVTKVRPQQGFTKGEIELTVLSGGPVFLFEEELDATAATPRTNGSLGDGSVNFDLGATTNAKGRICKESFPSIMTLAAAPDTIGFIRFKG